MTPGMHQEQSRLGAETDTLEQVWGVQTGTQRGHVGMTQSCIKGGVEREVDARLGHLVGRLLRWAGWSWCDKTGGPAVTARIGWHPFSPHTPSLSLRGF